MGGVFTQLIERNTTIPTKRSQIFTTADDTQTSVEVHVLQGERDMARYNRTIGRFHLDGIPPAPRGVPQIEVTFDIDANGIMNVHAKDLATSKEQHITITASSGLDDAEIDQMVDEAKTHAEEDKKAREEAELRNRADSAVYQAEKLLEEMADKITADEKGKIEAAVARLNEVKEEGDINEVRSATEALETAVNEMTTRVYQQAGAAYQQAHPGAGEAGGPTGDAGGPTGEAGPEPGAEAPGDDEVVDAEYEIIDDEEK